MDSGDNSWVVDEVDAEPTYVSQPPNGPGHARNVGIQRAEGEYIAFLDSDDYWRADKLSRQAEYLPEYDFVYSDQINKTPSGEFYQTAIDLGDEPSVKYFQEGQGIPIRTVVMARELLINNQFDEKLRAREDPHLWTRVLRRATPKRISDALATKRKHEQSLTTNRELVYEEELEEISDLVSRYDEYEPFEQKRLYEANFRRARKELSAGNVRLARKFLNKAKTHQKPDYRYYACALAVSLPIGNRVVFAGLQKLQSELDKR